MRAEVLDRLRAAVSEADGPAEMIEVNATDLALLLLQYDANQKALQAAAKIVGILAGSEK